MQAAGNSNLNYSTLVFLGINVMQNFLCRQRALSTLNIFYHESTEVRKHEKDNNKQDS